MYTQCAQLELLGFSLYYPFHKLWGTSSHILEVGYVVLTRPVTLTTTMAELQ